MLDLLCETANSKAIVQQGLRVTDDDPCLLAVTGFAIRPLFRRLQNCDCQLNNVKSGSYGPC